MGQGEIPSQPVLPFHGPAMYRGGTIASADDGTNGDNRDIDEEVFAIACMPGIGKRFEVRPDGANIDQLGHERHP